MSNLSTEPVAKEWRCYHCDEVFTSDVDAWHHFGRDQTRDPACKIKAAGEYALLEALRNAEDQLARYHNEDSDIIRAMWSMQADHSVALRREEELGYARGLRDARLAPDVSSNQDGHQSDEPSSSGGFGTTAEAPSSPQSSGTRTTPRK